MRSTLLTKYYSGDQIKKNEIGRVELKARRQEHKALDGKRERKRPLGLRSRTRENSIKTNLKADRWSGMVWIDLAQDAAGGGRL